MINSKYTAIFSLAWQNGLVYRVSLLLWRFRNLLSTIMALTIWQVMFNDQSQIANYNQTQMASYILLISIVQGVILSTSLHGLANDIYSGQLSILLVRPINIFKYLAAQETADKIKNTAFAIIEAALITAYFHIQWLLPSWGEIMLFSLSLALAVWLFFALMLILGGLGFWSPESWAPRYLLFVTIEITGGRMFPLDILPDWLEKALYFTPFPYLSYTQVQILLGRTSLSQQMWGVVNLFIWAVVISLLASWQWRRGRRDYAAAGA